MGSRVLVVDDERDIRNALRVYLESEGYEVFEAEDGQKAVDFVASHPVELILLDVMMPVMDGIIAMSKIRSQSNVPIIMLTAKGEDTDKVLGLNVGADDYVTKPFNPVELLARVKSQIRRYTKLGNASAQVNLDHIYSIGGIELNDQRKEVTLDGEEIALTPREYEILKFLMEHPSQVFSPSQIYEKVWNDPAYGAENTVAVHIRHLREKIEYDSKNPRHLVAVWGHGYKMEP